jgi:hypothetical protein
MEMCSCKMFCPCWLGPEGEPDEGWCGGAFAYDIREGSSDGVDLGGTRAVMMAHWPANFFHGQGKARIYVDEGANDDQARELEGILSGGVLNPLTNGGGQPTVISGAMAQAGFNIDSMQIALPGESQWSDPGMGDWRAADGVMFDISWSG